VGGGGTYGEHLLLPQPINPPSVQAPSGKAKINTKTRQGTVLTVILIHLYEF